MNGHCSDRIDPGALSCEVLLDGLFVCPPEPEIPAALPAVSLIGKFVLATKTVMLFWLGIAPSAIINLLAAAFG
jgi:hypothetical protein